MENCVVDENINNDFLSQSYSQGIERITGTKDRVFNFQIPKELLEVREKTWDNLFDKYSREMSDDIELNVDTLEPEEEQDDNEVSEEEYGCGQRIPMRKPATLVQYWVNTGNPPYKVLLDENKLSETGSSLSEKEIISSMYSPISNVINEGNEQEHKSDSSCSSVDTAAYILSNANVTKKADTIAIIEGAKCINIDSSRNVCIKDTEVASNDKIDYIETVRSGNMICNNDNSDINIDTEFSMSAEYMTSKTCDQLNVNTAISVVQPNMYLQSSPCKGTDKIDVSSTNQRSSSVQRIDDIASIFRQFDGTSKRLTGGGKSNSTSNQDEILEKDTSREKQVSANIVAKEIIVEDTSMAPFHRKKLYTGRDSPVDLILTKRHSISRLSGAKQSLHPALDPDSMIKRETFLIHKNKTKHLSPSDKRDLGFEKSKQKRRRRRKCSSVLSKNITDTSNKINDNIRDSIIDCSFNSLSDSHNNSDGQIDIPPRKYDDTNISVKKSETCKQDLASLNLNPVVILERITPSFKQFESRAMISNHMEESNICNNRHLNKFKKSYTCEIENLELEMIDSDETTILICQCKRNTSQCASSPSNQSLNLKLSIEDDSSVSNAAEKDDKESNLKNASLKNINQNKELRVILEELPLSAIKNCTNTMESQVLNKNKTIRQEEILNKSKIHSNSYGVNTIDNVRLRDIKIVLERLPLSVNNNCTNAVVETQILNKNVTKVWQKEILDKTETHFFNPYRTNKIDNVKLPEIKVLLERLSSNICLERSNDITNTNTFADKKKILRNTSMNNSKIESRIRNISKILSDENVKTPIRTICNNPSKMHAKKFKKIDDRINDTSNMAKRGNQVIDKVKSNSTFQYKNYNKINRDNHNKYSILTFTSSDEDDLVRLIKCPKKRLRMSKDDKSLGEMNTVEKNLSDKLVIANKNGYHYNGNSSTVIHSSKKVTPRGIGSIKKKAEQNGVDVKSFGSKTATTSLRMCENERFLFFPNENDYNNVTENLDERNKRATFFKCDKSMNNDNKSHLGKAMKNNGLNKDDISVIFFQTKTFDSSDSEESNSYTLLPASTRKALKSSPVRHRSRYYNHANSEGLFNDSIAEHSSPLSFSLEKHDVTDQVHNIRTRARSIGKETKISKHLTNEEFNENINSRGGNNIKKDISFSSFVDNINASIQEKTSLYTSVEGNNVNILSEHKTQNSDKSKSSIVIEQDNVKPAVKKLLTFQTKNYYDSDSNESL